ncbi:MAG: class I SAM-dependent methyltransferase [Christensenellaceae bacterium]|jgi:O-methyltransferase involved in polyketide biosynthesis|nr:class I SAM-dependent methyltransferase [Christensenellaceae bacterium]
MSRIINNDDDLLTNDNVPSTMFLPLYGRMIASNKFPEILQDHTAEYICNNVDYDFSKLTKSYGGEYTTSTCLIRSYRNDQFVKNYLKDFPNGVVVNLGAGLDDTFSRINNGSVLWYNLDLPEVIKYREKFIPSCNNSKNISKSMFDYTWFNDVSVPSNVPILIIAEGIFFYFAHSEIIELYNMISKHFKTGFLYFDACSQKGVDYANKIVRKTGNSNSEMKFWVNNEQEILSWSKTIKNVKCSKFFDEFTSFKKFKFSTRFIMKITDLSKRTKFVTIEW